MVLNIDDRASDNLNTGTRLEVELENVLEQPGRELNNPALLEIQGCPPLNSIWAGNQVGYIPNKSGNVRRSGL